MKDDPILLEITRLCGEHSRELIGCFLSGSRAWRNSGESSDYDVLLVHRESLSLGALKLIYAEAQQVSPQLDCHFLSEGQARQGLHFSHPLFPSLRAGADYGLKLWGDPSLKLHQADELTQRQARAWWGYVFLHGLQGSCWSTEEVTKYFPKMLLDVLSLDPRVPAAALGASQKLAPWLESFWPEGHTLFHKEPTADSLAVAQISQRLWQYVVSDESFVPLLFKLRLGRGWDIPQVIALDEREQSNWNKLEFGESMQVSGIRERILRVLNENLRLMAGEKNSF